MKFFYVLLFFLSTYASYAQNDSLLITLSTKYNKFKYPIVGTVALINNRRDVNKLLLLKEYNYADSSSYTFLMTYDKNEFLLENLLSYQINLSLNFAAYFDYEIVLNCKTIPSSIKFQIEPVPQEMVDEIITSKKKKKRKTCSRVFNRKKN